MGNCVFRHFEHHPSTVERIMKLENWTEIRFENKYLKRAEKEEDGDGEKGMIENRESDVWFLVGFF